MIENISAYARFKGKCELLKAASTIQQGAQLDCVKLPLPVILDIVVRRLFLAVGVSVDSQSSDTAHDHWDQYTHE